MKTIDSITIARKLIVRGIPGPLITFRDQTYALPTRADLERITAGWMYVAKVLGFTYQAESQDCDKFSRFAAAYAGLVHAKQTQEVEAITPGGFPLGEFYYVSPAGTHAITVAIVGEGERLEVVWMEPQTGKLMELTQAEIESCYKCDL